MTLLADDSATAAAARGMRTLTKENVMGAYFSLAERLWMMAPWLMVLSSIARVIATYIGIQMGVGAKSIARGDYILFSIVYAALGFIALGVIAMVAGVLDSQIPVPLLCYLAYPFAAFFLVRASVQRLRDIGWSPQWAWLLVFDGMITPLMLLLWIIPTAKPAARMPA